MISERVAAVRGGVTASYYGVGSGGVLMHRDERTAEGEHEPADHPTHEEMHLVK